MKKFLVMLFILSVIFYGCQNNATAPKNEPNPTATATATPHSQTVKFKVLGTITTGYVDFETQACANNGIWGITGLPEEVSLSCLSNVELRCTATLYGTGNITVQIFIDSVLACQDQNDMFPGDDDAFCAIAGQ